MLFTNDIYIYLKTTLKLSIKNGNMRTLPLIHSYGRLYNDLSYTAQQGPYFVNVVCLYFVFLFNDIRIDPLSTS